MRERNQERPYLPSGYWLDVSDPDILALRRGGGWIVAHFSAQGVTKEEIEQAAWRDYASGGKEQP